MKKNIELYFNPENLKKNMIDKNQLFSENYQEEKPFEYLDLAELYFQMKEIENSKPDPKLEKIIQEYKARFLSEILPRYFENLPNPQ